VAFLFKKVAVRSSAPRRLDLPQLKAVIFGEIGTVAARGVAKTEPFAGKFAKGSIEPRKGVLALLRQCAQAGIDVAWCTSAHYEEVEAVANAMRPDLPFDQFSTVVTIDDVEQSKPSPDAYRFCLIMLNLKADEVVAIEDTPSGIAAAKALGIVTIGAPRKEADPQDFSSADLVAHNLNLVSVNLLASLLDNAHARDAA
jgi:HAD superfamily hydrolase (TIGR01509 family)